MLTSMPPEPDPALWEVSRHPPILDALQAREIQAARVAIASHFEEMKSPAYKRLRPPSSAAHSSRPTGGCADGQSISLRCSVGAMLRPVITQAIFERPANTELWRSPATAAAPEGSTTIPARS